MRSAPGVPLTIAELQLSSPLPSPSRQSALNNAHSHQHITSSSSTSSSSNTPITNNAITFYNNDDTSFDPAFISKTKTTMRLPPIQFDSPTNTSTFHNHQSSTSDLYPLANLATPQALKKFKFTVDGIPSVFEEISTVHQSQQQQQIQQISTNISTQARKRSASVWDDERSFKRTELDTNSTNNEAPDHTINNNGTNNLPPIISSTTTTTNNSAMVITNTSPNNHIENMPDSPNSALPSPVSDLDESFYSIQEDEQEGLVQLKEEDIIMLSPTIDPVIKTEEEAVTMDTSNLMETFDLLPDNIQTYFMFQLLRRSSRHALRLANASIMQVLKLDILTRVPHNIALHILSFLDVKSLCRASSVNKAWLTLISQASSVWQLKMQQAEFHPSPRELAIGDYYKIVRRHTVMRRNWRLNRHTKLLLEGHEEDLVTCLQFDEEKIITTGSDDHRINVYDIKTGELKRVLKGHDGGVWALQYVGNTLVTGSIDRTIRVWDIDRGVCRFVLRGHSSTVRCLKIVMPEPIIQLDGSVRMEPSEPIIVSGSRDMSIRVWKLPDLEKEPELPLSSSQDNDSLSGEFLKFRMVQHEHSVRDLAVYGNTLVSGSYDNNVIVWNLETGKSIHTLKGHTMKVYCVAIDPKRRHCISGSLDASVRIWGIDDGECKYVLQGHSILVGLLGLVDDCLVSAAADATLRIWDPSNGDRLHILAGATGHQGPITSFQHDKYKIISGSEGGVKIWDTQTGELLHDLVEGATSIWRVSFDERRCIAAVKNENKTQLVVLDYGVYGLEGDDD